MKVLVYTGEFVSRQLVPSKIWMTEGRKAQELTLQALRGGKKIQENVEMFTRQQCILQTWACALFEDRLVHLHDLLPSERAIK